MHVDYLIVGAGFAGSVIAERLATQLNQKVLVIERRDHIGGDAYDYHNNHGHLVQRYGPHIFHSNNPKVFEYLSQFTKWRRFTHTGRALVEGKLVPVPFNLKSLYMLFSTRYASKLESLMKAHYGPERSVPILRLKECACSELKELGFYIYDRIYKNYTKKVWGLSPDELDPCVTETVPVWITWKDNYHHTRYTGVPNKGYTDLFRKMLDHNNIIVLTNTDYSRIKDIVSYKYLIYTGPIDEFFDYKYGCLSYRSVRFEEETIDKEWYQSVAKINFPGQEPYIRITEQKYITGQTDSKTTLVTEYPEPYLRGYNQPHYPILTDSKRYLHKKYLKEAAKLKNNVFIGRSADYKYYNMEQSVSRALTVFSQIRFSRLLNCNNVLKDAMTCYYV